MPPDYEDRRAAAGSVPRRIWRGDRMMLVAVLLAVAVRPCTAVDKKMQGMCYTPNPLKSRAEGRLTDDDYMSEAAKPLWGPRGRDDLGTIRKLGASVVRMYGNNPSQSHEAFLNQAHNLGISVIPGLSNYPYVQMKGNCVQTNFNCYSQIRKFYLGNLQNGFLLPNKTYHPALAHVIVINEPDNILQYSKRVPAVDDPYNFSKGVISAVDGMLTAEKEAKVRGALINFTVTTTFKTCPNCRFHSELGLQPGIRQMMELRNAFFYPEQYGYKARNNLAHFYRTRFLHSFNTQSAAWAVQNYFLPYYTEGFPTTPFYIEEFHVADIDETYDQSKSQNNELQDAMALLQNTPLLLGLSFFEFEVSVLKKEQWEHQFGMFALGNYSLETVQMFGQDVDVWCLVDAAYRGVQMSQIVTEYFEGPGIDLDKFCVPDPSKVRLSQDGYERVYKLGTVDAMNIFVSRLVRHLGGLPVHQEGVTAFSAEHAAVAAGDDVQAPEDGFQRMVTALQEHPRWAVWSEYPACVADRLSNTASVGIMIEKVCQRMHWFKCGQTPKKCKKDPWSLADYVFSTYALERQASAPEREVVDPMEVCYFNGTAIFAGASYFAYEHPDEECVVTRDPATTPLTEEGYQAVRGRNKMSQTAKFVERYAHEVLGSNITDDSELEAFSSPDRPPPLWMHDLRAELIAADWVCGGEAWIQSCSGEARGNSPLELMLALGWMWLAFGALLATCCLVCASTCVYVRFTPDEGEEWLRTHVEYRRNLRDTRECSQAMQHPNHQAH